MTEIDFKKIQEKWQKKWEEERIFEVSEDENKKKFYVLEMFPYPSADGLHMGHALNYVIGDVLARFKIMKGFNVLHPMGYDALGIPAENAAIKVNTHPQDYTNNSIKNYIRQQKGLGITYDWTRVINAASPDYYKWDQWIFLKMLEKGLAYQKQAAVNWCSECQTVLANEQVQNGKCWRHEETDVEIKHLKQWFFKITDYADELYESIDKLENWPSKTKAMQKNWIGKSHGTEIDFEIEDKNISNVIIVHGCPKDKENMIDIRKEDSKHWIPWIKKELESKNIKINTPLMPEPWEPDYNSWKNVFEEYEINEKSVLIGHSCGCAFLVRWLSETKKKIKKLILVAPSKIASKDADDKIKELYDFKIDESIKDNIKETIIFISDDKQRTKDSAKIYSESLNGKIIEIKNKGHFIYESMKSVEFPELLTEINNQKWPIFTTRPDTLYGVTFMVIAATHPRLMEIVTDEQKQKVQEFLKKIKTVSQKSMKDLDELNKEGVFTGSYAINPINNEKVPVYAGNFVVADYGSGMVMAVPAHDQRDFEFAKKYDIPIKQVIKGEITETRSYTEEGVLINSDKFNELNNKEAIEKITTHLIEKNKARKVVNFRLRDWLISRQRYWGTPIPIIHCEKCGAVPVEEKDLPIKLPREIEFGKGNPLLNANEWLNVKCPKCGIPAKRETDTMDTFVNSSWYFLRYTDPKNNEEIFNKEKAKYWCPIDQYIGGAEHACMHLIYSRFYTKFLADLGLIDFREPAKKLFHQGMLHGEGGIKMSKSKGNVVNPEKVSEAYGIDTARYFLLSLAEPEKKRDWDEKGIQGSLRFIKKIFSIFENIKIGKTSEKIEILLNKTIKETQENIENFKYRIATIKLKELFEKISKEKEVSKATLEKSLKILNPICPHITEELWEKLGNKEFISNSMWPEYDKTKLKAKKELIDLNDKIINILNELLEKQKQKGKQTNKIYIYAMPFEMIGIDCEKIQKDIEFDCEITLAAVNDSNKYDPENKAKKAKPGLPSFYFE